MGPTRPSLGQRRGAGTSRLTARRRLALAFDPLAWALLLAGLVDGFSDNWVHAVFLIVASAAVWADRWARAAGHPGRPSVPLLRSGASTAAGRRRGWAVAVVVLGLYAVAAGSLRAYTWPMTVAVTVPAALGLVLGWRGPLRDRPVPAPVGLRAAAPWWAVLVVGGLWELAALLMQPNMQVGSVDHPTLSFLMDSVVGSPVGRMATVGSWLALGWYLLACAPRDTGGEDGDELA